jgi:hypothetical protein
MKGHSWPWNSKAHSGGMCCVIIVELLFEHKSLSF